MRWSDDEGVPRLEAELPGAIAVFSTRDGGISGGDFRSLNLGVLTEDEEESVRVNRRRLSGSIGIDPSRVVIGRQIHGAEIETHDRPQDPAPWAEPGPEPPPVDGHVVTVAGLAALVFVADCLPIAIAGDRGVAMVHGGWRGLAGGIVGEATRRVGGRAAVIGPGIGPCCYEVGEEVLAVFAPLGDGLADGRMLDLKAVARRLLERAGVDEVEDAELCTCCERGRFFSHRGDGPRTGRQAGIAWLI